MLNRDIKIKVWAASRVLLMIMIASYTDDDDDDLNDDCTVQG